MNRKGFTLIELIATIIILALVASISAYSVVHLISGSKQKNFDILVKNIKAATEIYYQECKYEKETATASGITCSNDYSVTLGNLVTYGYLKGNKKNANGTYSIINPKDDANISSCKVKAVYSNGKVVINAVSPTGSCPVQADYNKAV